MIPKFPIYLFDIDGTLLDSAEDICGAVREVLSGVPTAHELTDDFLKSYIGRHLTEFFRDAIPDRSSEEISQLIQQYRGIYLDRAHNSTRPYPGVGEALSVLDGRKATATTKGTETTRAVLTKFGLIDYFDHVQGTDGFPSKPAPDVLNLSMSALDARPEDCLMVGDSAADMEAGRRAGVRICAVRYGYGKPEELGKFEPDYWISDLRELVG